MQKTRPIAAAMMCACLALCLAIPALAAEPQGGAGYYVISDDNPDPALRHGDDCVQDVKSGSSDIVQSSPGDAIWPGHMDGVCYKTGLFPDAQQEETGSVSGNTVTDAGGAGDGQAEPGGPDVSGLPVGLVYKPPVDAGIQNAWHANAASGGHPSISGEDLLLEYSDEGVPLFDGTELPDTGGPGAVLFFVVGMAGLALAGAAVLFMRRKA